MIALNENCHQKIKSKEVSDFKFEMICIIVVKEIQDLAVCTTLFYANEFFDYNYMKRDDKIKEIVDFDTSQNLKFDDSK